ncbi:uncharacterized protein MONOS_9426 [Monocercomonoides exilis]|uniref:uncharacterized protein n=1 Tax=Monocercomonoides exilis TaxID=2049356 RepID=UPI003559C9C5|nr:hypothetical protein MONOS_9426 [Monocercomonoides exilis]|eukprot:MONOS_9426.1-p1 / transcript=MONOS_9426.1 / gene=MONOS_9426 / organism=Monocercomonoides_exilis_PA203 / gene_product=unspecified product / transcript_product=unspecified product / location=Mono_scaffold00389:13442-15140(+) / protein_length=246 / sequence_SO=supercontig / SO=protein_coding / is_pseudo=false
MLGRGSNFPVARTGQTDMESDEILFLIPLLLQKSGETPTTRHSIIEYFSDIKQFSVQLHLNSALKEFGMLSNSKLDVDNLVFLIQRTRRIETFSHHSASFSTSSFVFSTGIDIGTDDTILFKALLQAYVQTEVLLQVCETWERSMCACLVVKHASQQMSISQAVPAGIMIPSFASGSLMERLPNDVLPCVLLALAAYFVAVTCVNSLYEMLMKFRGILSIALPLLKRAYCGDDDKEDGREMKMRQ